MKNKIFIVVLCILCIALPSCGKENSRISVETFLLENSRGEYTYGEYIHPEGEKIPTVFMCHGYRGTLNSGGAEELSYILAERGIGAIRIDFNGRTEKSKDAQKADSYTLESMIEDSALAINHCIREYGADEERLYLYGRSMGGRAAMIMANESANFDYKALCLVSPAGDENAMIYYMGGTDKWEAMKKDASEKGYVKKQGLKLSHDWFMQFEDYNPKETGYMFGDKPVFVIYNIKDHVVLPETSLKCAKAYGNCRIMEVETEDGHGLEMGYDKSELKDEIMQEIADFFEEAEKGKE